MSERIRNIPVAPSRQELGTYGGGHGMWNTPITHGTDVQLIQDWPVTKALEDVEAWFDCTQFVFGMWHQELWLSDLRWKYTNNELLLNPVRFLQTKGWEIVEGLPQRGDVIAYGNTDEWQLAQALYNANFDATQDPPKDPLELFVGHHFAVFIDDQHIAHKAGAQGGVYVGDINAVPSFVPESVGPGFTLDKGIVFRKIQSK